MILGTPFLCSAVLTYNANLDSSKKPLLGSLWFLSFPWIWKVKWEKCVNGYCAEAATRSALQKSIPNGFAKFRGKHMCQSLLFKKQTSAQVVSSKFCEIFKNTFLQNTSRQLLVKVSKCGVFSGPYFPVFGLNLENDGVNLRIQSKYRKIRTSKNSAVGKFSRSDDLMHNDEKWSKRL